MSNLKEKTQKAISQLVDFLSDTPWRNAYVSQLQALALRLEKPCVLAVAGEVKAGKSSFINAFLGQDLALTGNTETTATINYFRYGHVPDPEKPVRCVWNDGSETWESQAFLDSLQGHTEEILERANDIQHLEFFIDNPKLVNVQLVDTPGTTAYVGQEGQAHEQRTARFLQLQSSLRERHDAETQQLSRDADAVIYLMTGHAANQNNINFLNDFIGDGKVKSYNAIAIMAKIDTNDQLLANLQHYVDDMARIVNERLPLSIPILPVSSGIYRAIVRKSDEELLLLQQRLREGFAERKYFAHALAMNERFDGEECRGCTLPQQERIAMHKGIPWRSFVVIATELYDKDVQAAKARLLALGGFKAVDDVLETQFFQRGMILRCHTVLQDCCKLLFQLRNDELFKYSQRIAREQDEVAGFIDFVMSHPQYSEAGIGGGMRRFLARKVERDRSAEFEPKLTEIAAVFEELLYGEINVASQKFEGLQMLAEHYERFSEAERQELARLFRSNDGDSWDPQQLAKRQQYWRSVSFSARAPKKEIAELAEFLYGYLIKTSETGK